MKSFINTTLLLLSIFVLYLYVHNPVLMFNQIGTIKYIYPLCFFAILPQVRKYINQNRDILYVFVFILCYCILRTAIGGDFIFVKTTIVAIIELFVLPIVIVHLLDCCKIDLIKVLLLIGVISSIITLVALLNPEIHSFFSDILYKDSALEKMTYRGFGISEGLTYAYGITLGMIGFLSLAYSKEYRWSVFFLPLVALSILVNARTGFVVFAIGVIIYLIYNLSKVPYILLAIILLAVVILNINFEFENEYTSVFIEEFFYEMSDFFLGTDKATYSTTDTLFKDMLVLPTCLQEWLMGKGYSLYLGIGKTTDMGFLLQLNYGGIYYCLLLFVLMFVLLRKIFHIKYLCLFLFLTFIISNLKGEFLLNSGGARLMSILILYYSLFPEKVKSSIS